MGWRWWRPQPPFSTLLTRPVRASRGTDRPACERAFLGSPRLSHQSTRTAWRRCHRRDQPMEVILAPTGASVALDVEHLDLSDPAAENDSAFTRHDSALQSSRDSGVAATSSAASILWRRSPALPSCVHRHTSPRLLALPSGPHSNRMARASRVGKSRYKDAELV